MSIGNVSSNLSGFKNIEKIINVKLDVGSPESRKKEDGEEQEDRIPTGVLKEKVESMNEFLIPTHTSLKFQLHEQSDEYFVQVVDDKTKEVIREIPDRKFLDMYAAMAELVGIVVDEKI